VYFLADSPNIKLEPVGNSSNHRAPPKQTRTARTRARRVNRRKQVDLLFLLLPPQTRFAARMDIPVGTIELPHQRSATSIPNKISPTYSKKGAATQTETFVVTPSASIRLSSPLVSFGRDTSYSVRLQYPAVAPLHARVVFNEDRKAFVEVLGANGVVVDGCVVYPVASPGGGGEKKTALLTHGSELEIHGKRFRFTYPPKEMRAALAASPARASFLTPFLIMLLCRPSAQVFFRPSHDPRQNLRVLQSPLRLPSESDSRSPSKSSIKSRSPADSATPSSCCPCGFGFLR
jgi:pSer/pThr/pTyr-binding forkhead associated (FHA) protein